MGTMEFSLPTYAGVMYKARVTCNLRDVLAIKNQACRAGDRIRSLSVWADTATKNQSSMHVDTHMKAHHAKLGMKNSILKHHVTH